MADITEAELVRLMVGRAVHAGLSEGGRDAGRGAAGSRRTSATRPSSTNVSFTLRRGEILGFYGLVGAGRSEVMQALFGLTNRVRGSVRLEGKRGSHPLPADAIAHGIAYVPEDRQHQGAHLSLPIMQNITLPILSRIGSCLRGRRSAANRDCAPLQRAAGTEGTHLTQTVSELSGGNQQKVVIGKWLATNPKVIILDEPTKGIDVGSKAAVHRFISRAGGAGACR